MASKKALLILALLLVQVLAVMPGPLEVPMVWANGSVPAWSYSRTYDIRAYPDDWNPAGADTAEGEEIEDKFVAQYISHPQTGDTITISNMNYWYWTSSTYNPDVELALYDGTKAGGPETRLDHSGDDLYVRADVPNVFNHEFLTYTLVETVEFTPSMEGMWLGTISEEEGYHTHLNATGSGSAHFAYKAITWTDNDDLPATMTGETVADTGVGVVHGWVNATGTGSNSSSLNTYYGTALDYVARRDFNLSLPGASVTDIDLVDANVTIYLSRSEKFLNITADTGAVSGYVYTEAFNSTHSSLVLDKTDLDTYGYNYAVYTESYVWTYTLDGLYWENGTRAGSVTVTAYLPSGSQAVVVDGVVPVGYDEEPIYFSWAITGGASRAHYPSANGETVFLTDPGGTSYVYAFDIVDYTGQIGYSDSYLKAQRIVNGSQLTVQVMVIPSTAQDIPLTLEYGEAYTISVIMPGGVIQSFGYFVAQNNFNPTLVIQPQGFSSGVYQSQRYLLFEATRNPAGTTIQGQYNDTGLGTQTIYFEIRWLNGSVLYSTSANANQTTFQYLTANNETDYVVWMRAVTPPSYFGNITYQKSLSRKASTMPLFNFSLLGTLPSNAQGQDAPQGLFALGMSMAFVGATSVWSAPVGIVVTLLMGGVMHRWGWWTLDMTLWASALCFAIVFIIVQAKRYTGGPG